MFWPTHFLSEALLSWEALLATSEHGKNDLNTYDELPTLYLGMCTASRMCRFIQEKGLGQWGHRSRGSLEASAHKLRRPPD